MAVFELRFSADEGNVPGVLDNIKTKGQEAGTAVAENWDKITLAGGAAGLAVEGFARSQQDTNVQTRQLAASLDMAEGDVRKLATGMSDATFPLEDVLDLMELGRQRGLDSAEALEEYATFWDMVGDATGSSGPVLAEAGVALQQMGIAAGEEGEALAAFGYITENTTQDVDEFLHFIERMGPDLQDLGLDIDDTAAVLGAMEQELGLTGRTARQEFRTAIQEADGDLDKALETLGLSEDQFKAYRDAVEDSSGVIERNAQIVGDSVTPMQRLESTARDVMFRFGGVAENAANMAPLLMGLGPAIKGVTLAKQGMAVAQRAVNAAMRANPIGIVVTALALLVGGLVYAYRNSETFRDIVDAAFARVRDAAQWMWSFIDEHVIPIFRDRLPEIAATVRDVFVARIEALRDGAVTAFTFVRDRPIELVQALRDGVVDRVSTMRDRVRTLIDFVRTNTIDRIRDMRDTVLERARDLYRGVRNRFEDLRDAARRIFDTIYDNTIGRVIAMKDEALAQIRDLRDTARTRFEQIRDWITERVTTLKNNTIGLAQDIFNFYRDIFTELRDTARDRFNNLRDWLTERAQQLRDNTVGRATDMKDTIVTRVTELRDTARDRFNDLRDWLTDRAQQLYDNTIGRVTDMKDDALQRVRDLRDDAVGFFTDLRDDADSRMGDLLRWISNKADDIRDAVLNPFRSARDLIGVIVRSVGNNAIDALNNILRRISSFVNRFGGAINWVAGQLGLDDLVGSFSITEIPRLHSGTKNWAGGPAILHNEEMAVLPPGSRVFNASETQAIEHGIDGAGFDKAGVGGDGGCMFCSMGMPHGHNEFGGIGGGIWDSITSGVSDAWDGITDFGRDLISRPMNWVIDQVLDRFDLSLSLPGALSDMASALVSRLQDALWDLIRDLRNRVEQERPEPVVDAPGAPGADGWVRPASGGVTQRFGVTPFSHNYASGIHSGVDIGFPRGTPIVAANAGTVSTVHMPFGPNGGSGYGNFIRLAHGGGIQTLYAHMLDAAVSAGNQVRSGQRIGRGDNTGFSTGDHLHFEVIQNGRPVDPANFIPLANGGVFDKPTTGLFELAEAGDTEIVSPERKMRSVFADVINDAELGNVEIHFHNPTIVSRDDRQPDDVMRDAAWGTINAMSQAQRRRGLR